MSSLFDPTSSYRQEPNPPPPEPPVKVRRHRARTVALVALAAFVVAFVIGAILSPDDPKTLRAATGPNITQTAEETTEPLVIDWSPTKASSYKLSLKTLEQDCFGDAGCNVTVRVSVSAADGNAFGRAVDITYQVTGGDEGSLTDTISIDAEGNYTKPELNLGTPNRATKLHTKITDVELINS